jgi:hypothetical protein
VSPRGTIRSPITKGPAMRALSHSVRWSAAGPAVVPNASELRLLSAAGDRRPSPRCGHGPAPDRPPSRDRSRGKPVAAPSLIYPCEGAAIASVPSRSLSLLLSRVAAAASSRALQTLARDEPRSSGRTPDRRSLRYGRSESARGRFRCARCLESEPGAGGHRRRAAHADGGDDLLAVDPRADVRLRMAAAVCVAAGRIDGSSQRVAAALYRVTPARRLDTEHQGRGLRASQQRRSGEPFAQRV